VPTPSNPTLGALVTLAALGIGAVFTMAGLSEGRTTGYSGRGWYRDSRSCRDSTAYERRCYFPITNTEYNVPDTAPLRNDKTTRIQTSFSSLQNCRRMGWEAFKDRNGFFHRL
jgi:hypothetical protein